MSMTVRWTGPFLVRDYMDNAINKAWESRWPPPSDGIYLVTQSEWSGNPTSVANPLYVGGNTGRSERFCTRVGDLIADMHGFFDGGTGHHSGGQELWRWCDKNQVKPGSLWLAWANQGTPWCARCAERVVHQQWKDIMLNRRTPSGCGDHSCACAGVSLAD